VSVSPRIKRIAVSTVASAAAVAIALAALPYLFSGQHLRGVASRAIHATTGLVPRIDGPVRLVLLPRPAIQVQDIHLDDGSKSGLAVGSLQASLEFAPLLFGEAKVATLTLDRLRVDVEFSSEGRLTADLPINTAISSDADVPELRVVNGSILLRVQGRDRVEIISGVNASLNWSAASLTATASFMLGNKLANGSLVIADTAALAKGQRSALRLRVESEPARLAYEGGITFRESAIQAEGSFSADGRSLREALALFGVSVPSPTGFGRFSIKSTLALTPIALTFSNLSLELDGNRADGGLVWKRDGTRSVLQGSLASEAADLSIYQLSLRLTAGNGNDWSRAPIDASAFQHFDLDLRLSCGKLTVGKVELGKVAIALSAKNRQLTAAIGEAQFYGGALRGNAVWNAAEANASLRLEANLTNFDLERGLGGLTGFRRLEGRGSLSVAVTSQGKTVLELASALSGKVQLAMKQGTLAGINAEAVLRRLERRPLSGTGDLRGGRTAFDRLTGNVEIQNGLGGLTNFEIESAILKISLHGDASITRRDFDLSGTARLIRAAQAGSQQVAFELPFLINGSWDNPYLLPDPEALIRHSGATAPLLDAVRGRAAREAMRNVIEMVTGLRSIGELPPNPSFDPPAVDAPTIAPIYAPAPQSTTQSR